MRAIKDIPLKKLADVVADLAYEGREHINCSKYANGLWTVEYSEEEPDGWEGDLTNQL